jgi:hypothetical protein
MLFEKVPVRSQNHMCLRMGSAASLNKVRASELRSAVRRSFREDI